MKKILFVLLSVFILAACGTFKGPWKDYPYSLYNYKPTTNYTLDQEYSVSVGSIMIRADKGIMLTHYKPIIPDTTLWKNRSISKYDSNSDSFNHRWVTKFLYDGEDGDYILTSSAFYRGVIGIIVKEDGTVPTNPVLRLDRKGSLERHPINIPTESRKLFSKVVEPKESKGSFRFELIYTGIEENNLNIVYREYVDDFARSSFFQNLTYNLNNSKIISFKSVKIEVIESNNSQIRFKVLSDNNLDWMP